MAAVAVQTNTNHGKVSPSTPGTSKGVSSDSPIDMDPSTPPDSRGASDPRINMEEYAYNKIFVGGLHYDTRDRKLYSLLLSIVTTMDS
jgi:hypothetical protein